MDLTSFDKVWDRISGGTRNESVSKELKPLLETVYAEIMRKQTDLDPLKNGLERLLLFLATSPGRVDANCSATSLFFLLHDEWQGNWVHLPDGFAGILDDMGMQLHDAVSHPEVAQNFSSLPEQLLEKVRQLQG